jgi:hypothetical protein
MIPKQKKKQKKGVRAHERGIIFIIDVVVHAC